MSLQDILKVYTETDYFIKECSQGARAYVASGAIIKEDFTEDNKLISKYSGPCHASMRQYADTYQYCHTAVHPDIAKNKGAVLFFDWLINKSAFRDCFVTKDPEACVTKGTIKTHDYDGPAFLAAAQLARLSTSEYRESFKTICAIMEDGYDIHPMLLLAMCVLTGTTVRGRYYTTMQPGKASWDSFTSHLPLSFGGLCRLNSLKAFCYDGVIQQKEATKLCVTKSWAGSQSCLVTPFRLQLFPKSANIDFNKKPMHFMAGIATKVGVRPEAVVEEKETKKLVAWEKAVEHFTELFMAEELAKNKAAGGRHIDLLALENLSKTLKLGELND